MDTKNEVFRPARSRVNSAVEIMFSERRPPKTVINKVWVSVVIARNPVNLGSFNTFKNLIQGMRRRQVAENQNRIRVPLVYGAQDVVKLSVRIAA